MSFATTLVLARFLVQEEFGVAAFVLAVVAVLDTLRGLGMGAALIFHDDTPEQRDYAFWLSFGISLALYGVAFALAPSAAAFFGQEETIPMLRTVAAVFPISALGTVHAGLLEKRLRFGARAVPELAHALAKGGTAVVLALLGTGAWSIVLGQVAGAVASTLSLWLVLPWRPRLLSPRRSAGHGSLLRYGLLATAVDSIGGLLSQAEAVLIGRFLGPAALGMYTIAARVPELLVKQMASTLGSVTFPVYASARRDLAASKGLYLATLRYLALAMFPVAIGIAVVSGPAVRMLFGERWADSAPLMQAIAMYALSRGLAFPAGSLMKAVGQPGRLTLLGLVQLAVTVPILAAVVSGTGSVGAMLWAQVAMSAVACVARLHFGGRLVGADLSRQLVAIGPAVLASGLMFAAVHVVDGWLGTASPALQLGALTSTGVATYLLGLLLFARRDVALAGATLRAMGRRGNVRGDSTTSQAGPG